MKKIVEFIKKEFNSNDDCCELTKFVVVGIVEFTLFLFAYRLIEFLTFILEGMNGILFMLIILTVIAVWFFAAIALLSVTDNDEE